MGDLTAAQMVTELQRRVTQISSTDALAAIQRAIRWSNRQGSFTFQLSDPTSWNVTSTGIFAIPVTMDVGKAHVLINANGTPIRKVGIQDIWVSGNYNLAADVAFDVYTVTQASFLFYPTQSTTKAVVAVFHLKTVDISGSAKANLPRDFDDLIIDLAEAEERRVYDVGDTWSTMLARSQDQIKALLDGYRSTTMEPMPTSEAAIVTSEKTQIGRA